MKNILEYLEHSVGRRPEKTACADTDTSMTWRQLREASARIGSLLLKHRLTHRPVAVYMEKHRPVWRQCWERFTAVISIQ